MRGLSNRVSRIPSSFSVGSSVVASNPLKLPQRYSGSVTPNRAVKPFRVLLGPVGGHVFRYSPGIKRRPTRFVNFTAKPPPRASVGDEFTVPSFEFRVRPASAKPNGEILALALGGKDNAAKTSLHILVRSSRRVIGLRKIAVESKPVVDVDLRNSKEALKMVLPRPRKLFGGNIDIAERHRPDRGLQLRRILRLNQTRGRINLIAMRTVIALCNGWKRQKRGQRNQ